MLKKFLSYSIGGWGAMLIGFITVPITTRLFSPEDFGRQALFTVFVNVISTLVGMGMLNAYVRFFYEEVAEKRNVLLFKCLKYPLSLMSLFAIGIVIFQQFISNYIVNQIDYSIIICLILSIMFECIGGFSDWTVRMQEKSKLYSLLTFLRKFLNFILVVSFYQLSLTNYKALIYAITITSCIVTIISVFSERRLWQFKFILNPQKRYETKHTSSEIFRYALPFLFSNIISWIFSSCDRMAIKQWSGLEELGLYSAAFSITAMLNVLQNSITTFIGPIIMKKYEEKDNVEEFLIKTSNIVAFLMFTFAILILLFKDIVIFILGDKYREAVYLMPLLIFAPVMYTISETTFYGIIFQKKSKAHLYVSIASSLVSFIGNILLVPYYGAKGAVIATALAWIVFFIARTYFSVKYYPIRYHLNKIVVCILITSMYCLYLTFSKNLFLSALIGLIILIIINFIYRKLLIEYGCLFLKKYIVR